eukprot:CFRG4394T1
MCSVVHMESSSCKSSERKGRGMALKMRGLLLTGIAFFLVVVLLSLDLRVPFTTDERKNKKSQTENVNLLDDVAQSYADANGDVYSIPYVSTKNTTLSMLHVDVVTHASKHETNATIEDRKDGKTNIALSTRRKTVFAVFIGDSNDRNAVDSFCKNVLKVNLQRGKQRATLRMTVATAYDNAFRRLKVQNNNSKRYTIGSGVEKVLRALEVNYCRSKLMTIAYIFNRFAVHPVGPWHGYDEDVRLIGKNWKESDPSLAHTLLFGPALHGLIRHARQGIPHVVSMASNFWDVARAFDYNSAAVTSDKAFWINTFIPKYSRNASSLIAVIKSEMATIKCVSV